MFQRCIKSKPAPLYHKNFAKRIELGNLTDDLSKISNVDWIIEVVTEKLKIKQIVFEQIEKFRSPGTLVTSNTSGIPIKQMNEGRSEDFRKNFAKFFLKSSDLPSFICFIGIPDVFEVTSVPGDLNFSICSKTICLIFNFSVTTSIIQSTLLILLKSSVKFPSSILLAKFL